MREIRPPAGFFLVKECFFIIVDCFFVGLIIFFAFDIKSKSESRKGMSNEEKFW